MGSLAKGIGYGAPGALRAAAGRRTPVWRHVSLWRARMLGVPLLWKLFGANAIIVVGTAASAVMLHVREPRTWLAIIGALLVTFAVNGVLVYLALRPLASLEETASRVSRGEANVRVRRSLLADRNMTRVGDTINRLVERLTADRYRMRKLASQVITAGEEERARIARQLQDSTAQTLAALSLQASSARRDCVDPDMAPRLSLIHDLTLDALEEIRALAQAVYPRVLDDFGLPAALKWLARRSSTEHVNVTVEIGDPVKLSREAEAVLYQVASEALANAVRHGNAGQVVMSLAPDGGRVRLEVADDGTGFDASAVPKDAGGFGLFAMRERVSLVDGAFDVRSEPGRGTSIVVSIPLEGGSPWM